MALPCGASEYLVRMALTAFCATCQRTVYIEADETAVCPVCSSPLLETIESIPSPNGGAAPDGGLQERGSK